MVEFDAIIKSKGVDIPESEHLSKAVEHLAKLEKAKEYLLANDGLNILNFKL